MTGVYLYQNDIEVGRTENGNPNFSVVPTKPPVAANPIGLGNEVGAGFKAKARQGRTP